VRLDVTFGAVREVGSRDALSVKSYVSLTQQRCEDYYPVVGVDHPCTASNLIGDQWVVSLPEPNSDIVQCAFHSIPVEEPVSCKSTDSELLGP
jgi:hypothetical protein